MCIETGDARNVAYLLEGMLLDNAQLKAVQFTTSKAVLNAKPLISQHLQKAALLRIASMSTRANANLAKMGIFSKKMDSA